MKAHKRKRHTSIMEVYRYNILISCIVGVLAILCSMCIWAVLVLLVDIPIKYFSILCNVCLAIGGYTSGYVSAIKRQKKGVLSGILCGTILFILILLLNRLLYNGYWHYNVLLKGTVLIITSAIGGIKSANIHNI